MEYIDLNTWPRKEQFAFFSGLAFPCYNVVSHLDVTRLHGYVKAHGLSFYHAMIYATMTVMNELPDFLYKIRGDKIVRHDTLRPSFVTITEDTHLLKIVNCPGAGTSMEDFCRLATETLAAQKENLPSAESDGADDMVYISCTPWFSFSALTNESDGNPDDSIPRITWGKYEKKHEKLILPYAVQLNHRLLDGYHLGLLLNGVQAYIDSL